MINLAQKQQKPLKQRGNQKSLTYFSHINLGSPRTSQPNPSLAQTTKAQKAKVKSPRDANAVDSTRKKLAPYEN